MSSKSKLSLIVVLFSVVFLSVGLMTALAGLNQLGDFVWYDEDGNGNKDGIAEWGSNGIDGVVVNLYRDDGDYVFEPGADDVFSGTMTTGDNPSTTPVEHGWYDFLHLGDNLGWWVEIPDSNFEHGGPLEGYVYTSGKGADASAGDNPRAVPFGRGPINYDLADFGFTLKDTVAIGNRVWDDGSGSVEHRDNGVMDADESGIVNVTVQLYADDGDGVCEPTDDPDADTMSAETTTDKDGIYQFLDVTPGSYCVVIPDSSIKDKLHYASSSTGGNHSPDSSDETEANGDDGVPFGDSTVSQVFAVKPGGQTDTTDADDAVGYADSSSFMTVDFGFLADPNAVSVQDMTAKRSNGISSTTLLFIVVMILVTLSIVGRRLLMRSTVA